MNHKYYVIDSVGGSSDFIEDINGEWSIVAMLPTDGVVHYILREEGPWEDRLAKQAKTAELSERQVKAQEKIAEAHQHDDGL